MPLRFTATSHNRVRDFQFSPTSNTVTLSSEPRFSASSARALAASSNAACENRLHENAKERRTHPLTAASVFSRDSRASIPSPTGGSDARLPLGFAAQTVRRRTPPPVGHSLHPRDRRKRAASTRRGRGAAVCAAQGGVGDAFKVTSSWHPLADRMFGFRLRLGGRLQGDRRRFKTHLWVISGSAGTSCSCALFRQ